MLVIEFLSSPSSLSCIFVKGTFALLAIFCQASDVLALTFSFAENNLAKRRVCVFQAANLNHSSEDRLTDGWVYPA